MSQAKSTTNHTDCTSVRLALKSRGYHPVPLEGKNPSPLGKNWAMKAEASTEGEITSWGQKLPRALTTGVLNRSCPFLDVDVPDKALARQLAKDIHDVFKGHDPGCTVLWRVGKSPKFAVPFRWTDSLPAPPDADVLRLIRPGKPTTNVLAHIEVRAGLGQTAVHGPHPDGGEYEWKGPTLWDTPKTMLPELNLQLLKALVLVLEGRFSAWAAAAAGGGVAWENRLSSLRPGKRNSKLDRSTDPTVVAWNKQHDLLDVLLARGYLPDPRGGSDRVLWPGSSTGMPGVLIYPDKVCQSHHTADPLNDGYVHDSFDVMRMLDHNGDFQAAHRAAQMVLGDQAVRNISVVQAQRQFSNGSSIGRTQSVVYNLPAPTPELKPLEMPPVAHTGGLTRTITPRPTILEGVIPCEPFVLNGAGKTGKSTVMIWLMIHLACGRKVLGRSPVGPTTCVLLSYEETRNDLEARLQALAAELKLSPAEQQLVGENLRLVPLRGQGRLVQAKGVLGTDVETTKLFSQLEKACHNLAGTLKQQQGLQTAERLLLVVDPLSHAGPGESTGNDGVSAFMNQLMGFVDRMAVPTGFGVISHVAKEVARSGIRDQYAGRGGGALADNARGVLQLSRASEEDFQKAPKGVTQDDIDYHRALLLDVHAMSHSAPVHAPWWLVRVGWRFDVREGLVPSQAQQSLESKLFTLVEGLLLAGQTVAVTAAVKEAVDRGLGGRNEVRKALDTLVRIGHLEVEQQPRHNLRLLKLPAVPPGTGLVADDPF